MSTNDIVQHIVERGEDIIFDHLDKLHRRGIHDNDVAEALRALGKTQLLDAYVEWGGIVLPKDEPGPEDTSDIVPDPITAPSYHELLQQTARTETFGG